MAGLAGEGSAEFEGVALAHSDPDALARVVAAAQGENSRIDETNIGYALAAALDRGPLALPDGSAPASLSAGAIKLGPVKLARADGAATCSATLDLGRLTLETRLDLATADKGLKFWSGPAPSAAVVVEDALDRPRRKIDAAGLAAGLATQAIARESDRIATLEADIRERAYFNRRLKGERFLDRRNAEIEDWRAEQERLKGLAERLAADRAEEERLAAEKAAAAKAAAEKAAAEKAAAEKAAAEKAAAEKAAAEKAAAEKADAPVAAPARSLDTGDDDSKPDGADLRNAAAPRRGRRAGRAGAAGGTDGSADAGRSLLRGHERVRSGGGREGFEDEAPQGRREVGRARTASTSATSRLTVTPLAAAIAVSRRQKASSSETLVRCPAIARERLTTPARPASFVMRRLAPMRLKVRSARSRSASAFRRAAFGVPEAARFTAATASSSPARGACGRGGD